MARKLSRSRMINRVEDELYDYKEMKKEASRITNDILHGTPVFDNEGGGRSSTPSDPTGKKATAISAHRRLQRLELWIHAIERIYEESNEGYKGLIEKRYWKGRLSAKDWETIADELHVSESTVYRWRKEICESIAYLTGER